MYVYMISHLKQSQATQVCPLGTALRLLGWFYRSTIPYVYYISLTLCELHSFLFISVWPCLRVYFDMNSGLHKKLYGSGQYSCMQTCDLDNTVACKPVIWTIQLHADLRFGQYSCMQTWDLDNTVACRPEIWTIQLHADLWFREIHCNSNDDDNDDDVCLLGARYEE
jgi:hypothetical protein